MSQNSSTGSRKWLLILVLLFVLSLGLLSQAKAKPKANVSLLLSKYGKYADWIQAQAKHETANFTSDVVKRANNLFGMKNASEGRKFSQLGKAVEGDPYRHYSNYNESIKDLIQWFEFTNFPTNIGTIDSYVAALKDRKYFGAPEEEYLNGLKRWI